MATSPATAPATPPQSPNQPYVVYSQPPSPPRKSRAALGAVIVIVIVLLLVLVLLYATGFLTPASSGGGGGGSPTVDVTAINIVSSANPCGVNGHSFTGYSTTAGGSEQDTLTITNGGLLFSCTINSVSATTSGLSISGANVPLTTPAGGTEALSFAIRSPNSAYTGVLTLDIE